MSNELSIRQSNGYVCLQALGQHRLLPAMALDIAVTLVQNAVQALTNGSKEVWCNDILFMLRLEQTVDQLDTIHRELLRQLKVTSTQSIN